jgi:hypothetical protein
VHGDAAKAYEDYGFPGVQFGARETYRWIREHHSSFRSVRLSHGLFNGNAVYPPFYLDAAAQAKISVVDLEDLCRSGGDWPEHAVWIARVPWYRDAGERGCPLERSLHHTIDDPRGSPVIEIFTLRKHADFDQWIARGSLERQQLVETMVSFEGRPARIEHTAIDKGVVEFLFDGDPDTLVRSAGINPFEVVLEMPPRNIDRVVLTLSHNWKVDVRAVIDSSKGRQVLEESVETPLGKQHRLVIEADQSLGEAGRIELSVTGTGDRRTDDFIHLNEISVVPSVVPGT